MKKETGILLALLLLGMPVLFSVLVKLGLISIYYNSLEENDPFAEPGFKVVELDDLENGFAKLADGRMIEISRQLVAFDPENQNRNLPEPHFGIMEKGDSVELFQKVILGYCGNAFMSDGKWLNLNLIEQKIGDAYVARKLLVGTWK